MPPFRTAALAAFIAIAAAPAGAQMAARSAPRAALFDAAARRAVVDTIAAQFVRFYVDADTGRLIADHLRARRRAGAYDAVAEPAHFAELLTNDLRAINGDRHLVVEYDPDEPATRPGREGIRILDHDPTPPPAVDSADRRRHFALGRLDVLPGNVGYLEITGFSGHPEARDAALQALRYLQFTDAIIFDLRRNGGGGAELVNFIISHFTGPDTVASLTVRNRSAGESFTRYTLASVPGPRRPAVPLYVLTSQYTGSAAEDFSFVLQNMKRATIVGGRTAGAGHNNVFLDSGHGFNTSISLTRVTDPRTGKEWERVGVQPDVRADPDSALDVAHLLALDTMVARASGARRQLLQLTREAVAARAHPRAVAPQKLAAYAGTYEEGRVVRLVGGQLLYWRFPNTPADTLVSVSDSVFTRQMVVRVVFDQDQHGTLRIGFVQPDGTTFTYPRVAPGTSTSPVKAR